MSDRAPCGTYAAYQEHIKRGEVPDRDCADANAVYNSQYRRRKMLGLPIAKVGSSMPTTLTPPRWVETCGDLAQVGAVFRAGVVMGA